MLNSVLFVPMSPNSDFGIKEWSLIMNTGFELDYRLRLITTFWLTNYLGPAHYLAVLAWKIFTRFKLLLKNQTVGMEQVVVRYFWQKISQHWWIKLDWWLKRKAHFHSSLLLSVLGWPLICQKYQTMICSMSNVWFLKINLNRVRMFQKARFYTIK